ncbi:hypothetical protein DVH05_003502 [Phytophthora capsici]|nr:hypothetical protein DVH05_003502 [Phytophthora capsici]
MKIVFAVIGERYLFEGEIKTGQTMKPVIARIAWKLFLELGLEDMVLVYKAVKPFEKDDEAVKKLQKGIIPAHIRSNLQIVSRNDTVTVQACATNKVHFVLDVPTRNASPVRFDYGMDRRYNGLAETAKTLADLSLRLTTIFFVLVPATLMPVFGVLGAFCSVLTVLAAATGWVFKGKANGKYILTQDDGEDGRIIIDSGEVDK